MQLDYDSSKIWTPEEDAIILGDDIEASEKLVDKKGIQAVTERIKFLDTLDY